ncbi:MAG: hypothetical protein MUF45_13600 [Spirosomaceae bacterium]|nr:hypothetical protein [Spirosomataceae bacterium]
MQKPETNKKTLIILQKSLVWFLFGLFVFNNFISFIFLESQLIIARKEVKEKIISKISKNHLVEITKPLGFDEYEFELDGIMYDVVEKQEKGGQLVLLCFADLNETELNHKLDKQIEKNLDSNPIKNGKNKKIIDFVKIFYEEVFFEKISFLDCQSATKTNYEYHQFSGDITISIPLPPPKY